MYQHVSSVSTLPSLSSFISQGVLPAHPRSLELNTPLLDGNPEAQRAEVVPEPNSKILMCVAAAVPTGGKEEGQSLPQDSGGQQCPCPSPGAYRPLRPPTFSFSTHLSNFLSSCLHQACCSFFLRQEPRGL